MNKLVTILSLVALALPVVSTAANAAVAGVGRNPPPVNQPGNPGGGNPGGGGNGGGCIGNCAPIIVVQDEPGNPVSSGTGEWGGDNGTFERRDHRRGYVQLGCDVADAGDLDGLVINQGDTTLHAGAKIAYRAMPSGEKTYMILNVDLAPQKAVLASAILGETADTGCAATVL